MSFLKPKAPKSTSLSENLNRQLLTSTYAPTMQQGVGATGISSALLTGEGDVEGANAAYGNYLARAGFQPAMQQLSRGITGQGAAAGLLRSGSTGQRFLSRGADLNNQFYTNYLQQLQGLSGLGLQAGGLVANAGQRSTGTSTGGGPSTAGAIGSLAGGIASIFSDRRLKRDIRKVDEMPDGLGIYQFRYIGENERQHGVMADEVARLRPEAVGPEVAGFATVNYEAL